MVCIAKVRLDGTFYSPVVIPDRFESIRMISSVLMHSRSYTPNLSGWVKNPLR
jgi:hypothetical protein